jgi:hypothetical protein
MGAAKRLLMDALETPNCNVLYIALTRFSAKGILWDDCLKTAARSYSVAFHSNETELSMKLGNGSNVYLAGADAKPDEMQKFLGRKYKTVIIDEAASYRIDLRKMVYQILKPATADLGGTIILAGTPGDLTKGLFYDVTTGIEPGWRVHKWSAFDNPYMATQWRAEIEELKAINPGIEDTPIFKQMYLGEWFVDTQKLVYKATRERNLIDALPTGRGQPYYVLGVDLGYDPDPSAFVLSCYFEHDPTLYFIEAWEKKKMLYSDVAERIQYYRNLHANMTIVVDAANKQGIEEMKQRYRLPLIASDKHGKPGFIELMNADLARGFIKCLPEADSLLTEMSSLVWDDTKAARVEHSACANHKCFVAGTLIETEQGPKAIETLKLTDKVLTRKGYKCIHSMGKTGEEQTTILEFSNGSKIECTLDHPILTNEGWIAANRIRSDHHVIALHQWLKKLNLWDVSIADTQMLNQYQVGAITAALTLKSNEADISTETCGNTSKDPFQRVSMSITKTETTTTTTLETLSASQESVTTQNTKKKTASELSLQRTWLFWKKSGHSPLNGINQKRVEPGIGSTLRDWLKRSLQKKFLKNAQYVEQSLLNQLDLSTQNSTALQSAQPGPAESLELITKREPAPTVKKNTSSQNSLNQEHAVYLVRKTIGTKKSVYNLSIEYQHEYFANGILVSNCDAALYNWRYSYAYSKKLKQVINKSETQRVEEFWEKEAMRIERKKAIPIWERDYLNE